jgi:hypothetical protein
MGPSRAWAQSASIGAGAYLQRYNFAKPEMLGIESITLSTIPFGARLPALRRLSFEVTGAYASGRLVRTDGSEATISGVTDTDVRASVSVVPDRLVLSATWIVPTGHSTQTLEEADVAGAVAADLLPFRISNWGSGGGFGIDAATTTTMGSFNVGLALGYSVAEEFEPIADDERAYLPGNSLNVRVAADRNVGSSGKLAIQFGVQRFGDDALDGKNLYRSGNRYQGILSYAFAAGARASGVTWGGWLRREQGTFLDASLFGSGQDTPAQDLILLGGGLRIPVGTGALMPAVDARIFRSSDGENQGYGFGAGMEAELPIGALRLLPSVRARFGSVLVREGVESGYTGIEAGVTLRLAR